MPGSTILIVEDEPLVGLELCEELRKSGYKPYPVISSGDDVLMAVRDLNPDLVMMDIRIRGSIDGVEAARQVRREFDTPLIFLTAFADRATLDRAAKVKPDGYLIKPFNETELLANIALTLEKHRLERAGGGILANHIAVIDIINFPMILFDEDGRLFHLNLAAIRALGYPDDLGYAGLQLADLVELSDQEPVGTWPLAGPCYTGKPGHLRIDSLNDQIGRRQGLIASLVIQG